MTDHAFSDAQAHHDAAEPDDELAPVGIILERVLNMVKARHLDVEIEDVHPLSDRQATAAIWIDGHEYSLTLNRED